VSAPTSPIDGDAPSDDEVLAAYPDAGIDADSIDFYRGLLVRRLWLQRCAACRNWHHPPRAVCPYCWSNDVRPEEHSGAGLVAMFTTLHAPGGAERRTILTADLDTGPVRGLQGLRFTLPLAEGEDRPVRGDRVSITWLDQDAPTPAFVLDVTRSRRA
jgi:uncharacterized OB-fold protein